MVAHLYSTVGLVSRCVLMVLIPGEEIDRKRTSDTSTGHAYYLSSTVETTILQCSFRNNINEDSKKKKEKKERKKR